MQNLSFKFNLYAENSTRGFVEWRKIIGFLLDSVPMEVFLHIPLNWFARKTKENFRRIAFLRLIS
jgi:hypothetical protein